MEVLPRVKELRVLRAIVDYMQWFYDGVPDSVIRELWRKGWEKGVLNEVSWGVGGCRWVVMDETMDLPPPGAGGYGTLGWAIPFVRYG